MDRTIKDMQRDIRDMQRTIRELKSEGKDYCDKCGGICPSDIVCKPLSRDHPIFKRR